MKTIPRFHFALSSAFRPLAMLAALLLVLSGCGGTGGSGSDPAQGDSGEVRIALTDAPGDFVSYAVDVLSITLTRANGTVVEALPVRTRLDFAQYTEMTEFITVATIPSGVYTGARLRLDYSQADIRVEDAGGNAVAAVARDSAGNAVTTLDLDVRFDRQRPLTIVRGVPAHLTLDFNLAASNQVDLVTSPPVVTVLPFLVADINPDWHKTHHVRGPLANVDSANSRFTLGIRPLAVSSGDLGRLTVTTQDNTWFEIDQTGYSATTGLAALALKPSGTATVVIGEVQPGSRQFLASEVYAGSSVPFGTADAVTGTVTARNGNTLTLRGASLERADGTLALHETLTVVVGDATRVTRQLASGETFSKDDLSVGQRLLALGTLSGTSEAPILDATQGFARLLVSSLTATVNSVGDNSIELALQTVNGRRVLLYDFTGTGSGPGGDADPAHYQVATGSLGLAGIEAGTPVRVRGFVRPFGTAPADFAALTLINVAQAPATLAVAWNPSSATPFASRDASGLTLALTGSPFIHHLRRGGVLTDLAGTAPRITPLDAARGLFAIGRSGTVTVYTRFDEYQQALGTELANNRPARAFGGHGRTLETDTQFAGRHLFTAFE